MSKGGKNRTQDRDAYRATIERIEKSEAEKSEAEKESDNNWLSLAEFLKFVFEGDENEGS